MFRPQIKNELTSNGLSQPVDNKDSHDYPTLSLFEQTRQKKINMRLYPNWSYKSIKLAVEDLDAQPAETVEAIAIEILGKLLKLGRHIAEEKRRAVDKVTDVVAQIDLSRPDLLPNQANVNYLLKQPIFQTADTVLNNYKRPINIRFESGEFL
ncbi:unnamed protein product [Didymodactylos carnosus]|uniref:Uncharacterized protein n=1 Tax=Didymodactylos carnosus TaxID=1234261 RepID=A0A813X2A2_9BILA|nr:unnamed protein product [Didymodactylos carnosus]CAF3651457.1 unnamed protein product [Didymodactylos carnosus]